MHDLVGKSFGSLTVVGCGGRKDGHAMVVAVCVCGSQKSYFQSNLVKGKSKRCRECSWQVISSKRTTHGLSNTKIYRVWSDMIRRCDLPTHHAFAHYGGRGIKVCDDWRDFSVFLKDMGERPVGGELDRIDVNGNYEPANCRWASRTLQMRNTRVNRKYMYKGELRTMGEIAELESFPIGALKSRLRRGLSIDDALTKPLVLASLGNKNRSRKI